jgi:predicted small lipoprotein YifL
LYFKRLRYSSGVVAGVPVPSPAVFSPGSNWLYHPAHFALLYGPLVQARTLWDAGMKCPSCLAWIIAVLTLTSSLLISGCGNKGKLYLPDDGQAQKIADS